MTLRPSLSLVYGVRIAAADVDRVRSLCDAGALPGCEVWDGGEIQQPHAIVGATGSLRPLVTCDGELADGLPLDVAQITDLYNRRDCDPAHDVEDVLQRTRPEIRCGDASWWIVGRAS